MSTTSSHRRRTAGESSAPYDAPKEFEGRRYTGMRVGRSHKWFYDRGEWRERKVTPDEWTFTYSVPKRRAGKAPEGSGVPVGTEYHWYVLADQYVRKLDANSYSTSMSGLKVKLAHKRAGTEKWSAGEAARRRHLIAVLRQILVQLEGQALAEPAKDRRSNGKAPARRTARKRAVAASAPGGRG